VFELREDEEKPPPVEEPDASPRPEEAGRADDERVPEEPLSETPPCGRLSERVTVPPVVEGRPPLLSLPERVTVPPPVEGRLPLLSLPGRLPSLRQPCGRSSWRCPVS